MSIDNGGSAFPALLQSDDHRLMQREDGMSLRDYFAAKALAALIGADKDYQNRGAKAVPTLTRWSYEYADAMLKARATPPQGDSHE